MTKDTDRNIIEKCYEGFKKENRYHSRPTKNEIIVWLAQRRDKTDAGSEPKPGMVLPFSLPTDAEIEKQAEDETLGKMVKSGAAGEIGLIKFGLEIGMKTMRDRIARIIRSRMV